MVESWECQRHRSFLTNIDPLEVARELRSFLEMFQVFHLDASFVLCSEENNQGRWDKPVQETAPSGS